MCDNLWHLFYQNGWDFKYATKSLKRKFQICGIYDVPEVWECIEQVLTIFEKQAGELMERERDIDDLEKAKKFTDASDIIELMTDEQESSRVDLAKRIISLDEKIEVSPYLLFGVYETTPEIEKGLLYRTMTAKLHTDKLPVGTKESDRILCTKALSIVTRAYEDMK